MLIVTTPTVDGSPVKQYLGIVSGEAISGINVFKDIGATFRNLAGGRAKNYEDELQKAYHHALNEMSQRAAALGANAVVGVRVDYFR